MHSSNVTVADDSLDSAETDLTEPRLKHRSVPFSDGWSNFLLEGKEVRDIGFKLNDDGQI